MLAEMAQRQLLQYAAGRSIWCECGALLDCLTSVIVERQGEPMRVLCGECFDAAPVEPVDARQLTLPTMTPSPPVEILDGREIDWPRQDAPMEGMAEQIEWRNPRTGEIETYATPSEATLERWFMDSMCEALDECNVEHDGHCPHGFPSWIIVLDLI